MSYTRRLATAVNCSYSLTMGTAEILRCLKQKSFEELLSADIRPPKYFSAFGPVIDGRSFLPSALATDASKSSSHRDRSDQESNVKVSKGAFGSTSVLAGVMDSEGLIFLNQSQLENGMSESTRRQVC